MTEISDCPDRQNLAHLLDPHASDEHVSLIEQHLLICDRCCQTIEELGQTDTLVEAARGTTAGLPDDATVQDMMARLKAICVPAAVDETLASWSEATGDAWGLEQLLDPAQAAGELGWFAGYRVLRVLGAGGMGIVFDAEDPQLQRHVALKVMKPSLAEQAEQRKRFLREARAAAAIEHAHIVAVYQVGEHRGMPFLSMQLLKGESLDDRLARQDSGFTVQGSDKPPLPEGEATRTSLPLAECLRIGRETAEALAVAHERRLIHRDVKPANIWLESPGGWVKLLDFGLAHAVEDVHLTQTGAILGTPAYMSPEQARGDAVGPRADLFSLGAVLYRLTTGRPPFQGPSTIALLSALALEQPRPPRELNPEVPVEFSDLIARLLVKNPDERFESAEAVVEAIRAIEQSLKSKVESPKSDAVAGAEHSDAPAPPSWRWPWLVAAAGAAAMLLASIVVVVRDKEGREVARSSVPEGGSVSIENGNRAAFGSGKVAAALRDGEPTPTAGGLSPASPPRSVGATLDPPNPFVIVRSGGKDRKAFKRFAEAVSTLRDGDEIEVHGNGPFSVPAIRLDNKGLIIRAARGYRPVLVAGKSVTPDKAWFEVQGGSLNLEGCDFHGGGEAVSFRGGGAAWEWRNCRFWTHSGDLVQPTGPRLAISDSLIWSGGLAIRSRARVDLVLTNNIVRSLQQGIALESLSGESISLHHNTILGGGVTWFVPNAQPGVTPVEVNAEDNLFDLRAGGALLGEPHDAASRELKAYQTAVHWHGRDNVYCGSNGPAIHAKDEGRKVEGLAAWRECWNTDEHGSIETPELAFEWDSVRVLPTPEAMAWLRGVVERGKKQLEDGLPRPSSTRQDGLERPSSITLGPNWDLIGPGEAYLRALTARGEPVRSEDLRPEPPDEGPFVVLREGKTLGHVTLQEAVIAAKSGDTIEIRTDGPFAGADIGQWEHGRKLVLRAAPGYLPVLEGDLFYPDSGDLTVAGIQVNGGGIHDLARCADSLHLVNCSFTATSHQLFFEMRSLRDKQSGSEIVNCWAPGLAVLHLDAGASISIRNSVVGLINLASRGAGNQQLHIERSVMWNPGCGAFRDGWQSQCLFRGQGEGRPTVVIEHSLLEAALGLVASRELNVFGWKNAGNLYRTVTSNLVDRLQTECSSGDEGSLAAAPIDFDPLQWRLLPGSPGYQAGPDGKDLGADVTRIATVAVAPKTAAALPGGETVAPALRDGSVSRLPDGRPTSPPRSVGATLRERPNPLAGRALRSHGVWLDRLPAEAPVVARLGDPRLVGLPNVWRLAYSPDGNLLAAAGDDRLVVLYAGPGRYFLPIRTPERDPPSAAATRRQKAGRSRDESRKRIVEGSPL